MSTLSIKKSGSHKHAESSYTYSMSKIRFLIQPWNDLLIWSTAAPSPSGTPPMYRLDTLIVMLSAKGPKFISTGFVSSSWTVIILKD